ncbi:MAG TPA: dihydrolipoamide acetyltransferase family protein [Aggregatilineales bacterium]|nr:dihydrolipoamide acetyltransferase family protein [Aggregatilineales bacterium]
MAELINMPKLGFDMREGQLINWLKQPGEQVQSGDVIAEIESDKATVEVEAYTSGTILQHLVDAGDWVPIGAPIAVVGEEGEEVDLAALGVEDGGAEVEAAEAETAVSEEPPAEAVADETGQRKMAVPEEEMEDEPGLPDGVRASPLARRVADDLGIDLRRVEGSGPQGRIVRADVEAYSEQPEAAAPAAPKRAPARPAAAAGPVEVGYMEVQPGADDEVIETPRMRARIGQRMVQSRQQVPHFYVTVDIDMEKVMNLRKALNERLADDGIKISLNDIIVKAAALTLRAFPNINAAFNGDTIVRYGHVNVGIAVAVEDGLINVVSRDADQASLSTLAQRHKEMIGRAREGKVKPEDVEGETFAVSNLGPWDVEHFVAIINPPSAAILALGTAQKVPVVKEDGSIGVGYRMKATLSADHRVTDGAEAAAFTQHFKAILEEPLRLLV